MHIANPIYDSVFKYLLDDHRVAKVFISAIIGEEIEELELRPTEINIAKNEDSSNKTKQNVHQPVFMSVFRIDFSAKIKTKAGEHKLIIIEIQKAKALNEIERFRRYLGENYSNANNYYSVNGKQVALPILPIYFLGDDIIFNEPSKMIFVERTYIDKFKNKKIDIKHDFIEALSHDCYVIQLKQKTADQKGRQSELEKLFDLFDQDNMSNSKHILNIKEDEVPEKFKPIIRRLHEAIELKDIKNAMLAEDEVINQLKAAEEKAIKAEERLQLAEKELELEKEKTKFKLILAEQEKLSLAINSAKQFKALGLDVDQICKITGLSIDDIEKLD